MDKASWKPFQAVHDRGVAIEAARWLRDRLAGIQEPGRPVLSQGVCDRVLRPKFEHIMTDWDLTEADLEGASMNERQEAGD